MSSKKHSPGSKRARRFAGLVSMPGGGSGPACGCDGDATSDAPTLTNRLSKSASELSTLLHEQNGGVFEDTGGGLQQRRVKSASQQHRASAQHHPRTTHQQSACSAVAHKTHNFFTALKSRWSRSRSRERVLGGGLSMATGSGHWSDAAASGGRDSRASDTSHSISSSSTPQNSPRRKPGADVPGNAASAAGDVSGAGTSSLAASDAGPAHQDAAECTDPHKTQVYPQMRPEMADAQRSREALLRQHSFFELRIHLKRGERLIAMDKSGTSDPYVKFKYGGRLLHKSKTLSRSLSPVWDEIFTAHIDDPFLPILVKVFDYDWGLQDDFMGCCQVDLTRLDLGRGQELTLPLSDEVPGKASSPAPPRELGCIHLNVTLWPRTQHDKEQVGCNRFITPLKLMTGIGCSN